MWKYFVNFKCSFSKSDRGILILLRRVDKEDALKTLSRKSTRGEIADVVKEDVQDERKEVDKCEEGWAVVPSASWSKGGCYICTEDSITVHLWQGGSPAGSLHGPC